MISSEDFLIQHSSNQTSIEAGRSYLCNRFIARDLSRLLILILLILSPLTYSNDSIPNFAPDGVSSCFLFKKDSCTVAVMGPGAPPIIALVDARVVAPHTPCPTPHICPVCSAQSSRASPV